VASAARRWASRPAASCQRLDERDVVLGTAAWWQDVQRAVFAHELEHALDGLPVGRRAQPDLERDVALLRVHGLCGRHGVEVRMHEHGFAERAEVAHERQGIHAVAQHLTTEANRDVPVVAARLAASARGIGVRHYAGRRGGAARRAAYGRIEAQLQRLADGLMRGPAGLAIRDVVDELGDVVAALEQQRGE
jgi:hypothetical protein